MLLRYDLLNTAKLDTIYIEGIGILFEKKPVPFYVKTQNVKSMYRAGKNFWLGLTKDNRFFIMVTTVSMM